MRFLTFLARAMREARFERTLDMLLTTRYFSAAVALVFLSFTGVTAAAPAAGETIEREIISGAGYQAGSVSYKHFGTMGQTVVGAAGSDTYRLNHGFWKSLGPVTCCRLRGDIDENSRINIADVSFLVDYLFKGGPAPNCPDHADLTGQARINVSALTYLVDFLFRQGPAPAPC